MPSDSESDELSQDSDFDDSGFEESTDDKQAKASAPIRNQPFDEALDVSQSMDQSMDQSAQLVTVKREKMLQNQQFDEALDVSQSVDLHSPEFKRQNNASSSKKTSNLNSNTEQDSEEENNDEDEDEDDDRDHDHDHDHDSPTNNNNNNKSSNGPGSANNKLENKPFDEFVEFSGESSEDSVDTNASPKNAAAAHSKQASQKQQQQQQQQATVDALSHEPTAQRQNLAHLAPQPITNNAALNSPNNNSNSNDGSDDDGSGDSSSSSGSESEEGEQSTPALKVEGAYDPKEYANLDVSPDIAELFAYILRYKPHEVELETSLKCFIPDYIPAVGEMDSFVKVPRPDTKPDDLGLKVLDEPTATQSDATVLELRLRAISKKTHGAINVKSIENASKNPREVERWITSINELHRSKPLPQVHYSKSMPDVEQLMDVWPEDFEDALLKEGVPLPEMNLDLSMEEYAKVLCSILDIPVYEGKVVESLHLMFVTFLEFQSNTHFMGNNNGGGNGGGVGGVGVGVDDDFGTYADYDHK